MKIKCTVCGAVLNRNKESAIKAAAKGGFSSVEEWLKQYKCKNCRGGAESKSAKVKVKTLEDLPKDKTAGVKTLEDLPKEEFIIEEEEMDQSIEVDEDLDEEDEDLDEELLDQLLQEEEDEEEI